MSPDTRPDPLADLLPIIDAAEAAVAAGALPVDVLNITQPVRYAIAHAGVTLTQTQPDAGLREALEKFVTGEGAMATDPDGDCYFCEAEGVDFELPFHPGADPDHAGEHEDWCLVPIARAALRSTPAAPQPDPPGLRGAQLRLARMVGDAPQPDAGLREADVLRANLASTADWLDAIIEESDPKPSELMAMVAGIRAALRSTPAAPTHTPKVMEAEAGRLLVESARIRAARLGPDDAHELRHLWAAINAGNSDPCGETCHLDADAIARWTEQYPKVMGLAALRPTPAAPLHPHDGYSYDGCKCVCCLNIRALATPAAQKPDAGLREALADQIATLYGWTAHEQASPRQRALYVLWREWHALVGERTEHPALSDERIESLSRQRAEECAALRSTPATPPLLHEWTTDEKHDYQWCRRCLHVRQANGSSDAKPCKGPAHVTLRSTPAAPKPDARSLADRITGVIAIPPDGEVEP